VSSPTKHPIDYSHVIRLLDTTSRLVAVASTIVRLERLAQQYFFSTSRRQSCFAVQVDLLNQLEA
jgi:hypothetical protein